MSTGLQLATWHSLVSPLAPNLLRIAGRVGEYWSSVSYLAQVRSAHSLHPDGQKADLSEVAGRVGKYWSLVSYLAQSGQPTRS